MMAPNSSNLVSNLNLQIQESQWTTSRINTKKTKYRKNKIVKVAREKGYITYRKQRFWWPLKPEGGTIASGKKNLHRAIPYPVKISLKNDSKVSIYYICHVLVKTFNFILKVSHAEVCIPVHRNLKTCF